MKDQTSIDAPLVTSKRYFWLGVVVLIAQLLLAAATAALGFEQLGVALFVATPLSVGIAAGLIDTWYQMWKLLGVLLAVPSVILIFVGIEGLLCVAMAAPILATMLAVGYVIGGMIRDKRRKNKLKGPPNSHSAALWFPVAIYLVSASVEQFVSIRFTSNQAVTELVVPYEKETVFAAIVHVDTVNANGTWLHKIGLPMPLASHLDTLAVGAKRTCYLTDGEIHETITALNAPHQVEMDMKSESMGRAWLQLKHDTYELESLPSGKTRIRHTTDFESTLRPRAYWSFVERLTVEAQHEVVFANLMNDLATKQ